MPPVSQRIDNLLGGVSQQPAVLRLESQGAEQINALDTPRGKRKRPPSVHVARLDADPTGYSGAFIHDIYKSAGEQYRVVVTDGAIRVFNALTGAEYPVQYVGSSAAYLAGAQYRAITIGEDTVVVNREVVVGKGAATSAALKSEALVSVVSAADATKYTTILDGVSASFTSEATGAGPGTTSWIASQLFNAMVTTYSSAYNIQLYNSAIYVAREDGGDFTLTASSDLPEEGGIEVVKGVVQAFEDLPDGAPTGFIVEVSGSPVSGKDNYWVRYTDSEVWEECAKPGILTSLDAATMPHVLTLGGSVAGNLVCSGSPEEVSVLGFPLFTDPHDYYTLAFGDTPFPPGYTLTAQIDSAPAASFTAGPEGSTVDEMAAGLSAAIDALADYEGSVISPGTIKVLPTGAATSISSLVVTATPAPGITAYLPDASLAPDTYVGLTVVNATDGSSGVITDDGAHHITVASLSGGVLNRFSDGDVLSIQMDGVYYTFGPAPWAERGAGDIESAPWPSFVGKTLNEVLYAQGRLGFISGESVVLSAAGQPFRFFRKTVTDLLADDYIDITGSYPDARSFHSSVEWNERIYLFADNAQLILSGDPVLSPTTVSLTKVSSYETSHGLRPMASGGLLFMGRSRGGATEILAYRDQTDYPAVAEDVTQNIPLYIQGAPLVFAGDAALGFLAVLSDADPRNLYIYSHIERPDGARLLSSWGRWELTAGTEILYATMSGGSLGLVCKRADGVYLESVDLIADAGVYLDRQVPLNSGAFTGEVTTWELPYSVAVDGSQGEVVVVRQDTGEEIPSTRPAATQVRAAGDYGSVPVVVGLRYEWRYTPTPIMLRDTQTGRPVTQGRLTLSYIDVGYADTDGMSVDVALQGRAAKTLTLPEVDESGGEHRLSIHGNSAEVSLTFRSNTAGPCTLLGMEWEGTYTTRNKRV